MFCFFVKPQLEETKHLLQKYCRGLKLVQGGLAAIFKNTFFE
ncbi:hypothetical protein HMPREF1248_1587 [Coriobacteriaceae bacterium BV3Ac1]|nr:hypothetical protein HMPREF1248_1587 [Coriobacteriaceae bacterium BV3Ac1]